MIYVRSNASVETKYQEKGRICNEILLEFRNIIINEISLPFEYKYKEILNSSEFDEMNFN